MPNWTINGSDKTRGEVILRCENAFPSGSERCMCEGTELGICVDGTRQLMIDRKQCGITCKPRPTNGSQIAVRCPDGSNPTANAEGCGCSGRIPFNPCAGGMASAERRGGECVVSCKTPQ
jgi:hypothetical protein